MAGEGVILRSRNCRTTTASARTARGASPSAVGAALAERQRRLPFRGLSEFWKPLSLGCGQACDPVKRPVDTPVKQSSVM
jgi:hypothetical protein